MGSVLVGFGLGFLVALQPGPMTMFLVRSTLRSGVAVGLSVAAGIAVVDAAYAALGAAGAAPLLDVDWVAVGMGVAGAAVLVWFGARTLLSAVRVRAGLEVAAEIANPRRAFASSLAATASNPATILSWAAIFAAASATTGASAPLLVLGVALGSISWVAVLASGVAVARRALGPRALRTADGVAGVGLVGFGAALGVETLTGH